MTDLLTALGGMDKYNRRSCSLDIIYMDFAKTFDSVPRIRLLVKLYSLAIGSEVLACLTNRKHKVAIEGESSLWTNSKSGIPQGSVLGPTLFAVFINDTPNYISSFCKMFTDDTKLYRAVNCTEDSR